MATTTMSGEESGAAKASAPSCAERRRREVLAFVDAVGASELTVSGALSGSPGVADGLRGQAMELARERGCAVWVGTTKLQVSQNRTVTVVIPFEGEARQHLTDPCFWHLALGQAAACNGCLTGSQMRNVLPACSALFTSNRP